MTDLFTVEWRRIRRLCAWVAAIHLLGLGILSRTVELMELGDQDQVAFLIVYLGWAFGLAVLQIGTFRQPGRWLWLMHRPLSPARIFAAFALAGLAGIVTTIVAPIATFTLGIDLMTTQVVDRRHYGLVVHLLLFATMGWCAGALATTSRHRLTGLVLLAPLALLVRTASVWTLLPAVLLATAWLAIIARHGFRVDRETAIARPLVLVLTALPLQLAFFLGMFQLVKGGVALGTLVSRGASSRTVLATDETVDIEAHLRRLGLAEWERALAPSTDPRAAAWRTQLPEARVTGLTPNLERFPVRHQLGNVARPWWDGSRDVKWTFSHDAMLYHGRHRGSGTSRGWWGSAGFASRTPYAEVPLGSIAPTTLYAVSADTLTQRPLVQLGPDERFTGVPVRMDEWLFLLTNRRLLAYVLPASGGDAAHQPHLAWALPIEDRSLLPLTVGVAEVADGTLVSLFYFDDWEYDGFEFLLAPWHRVVHVDATGTASIVASRDKVRDQRVDIGIHASVPVTSWWIAPALYRIAHLPDALDNGVTRRPRVVTVPSDPALRGAWLVVTALAIAAAWHRLRRSTVPAPRQRLWLAMCALGGVPAVLSLLCLEPCEARDA